MNRSGLSASASPVPTASTKQQHQYDDNQDCFDTHCKLSLRADVERWVAAGSRKRTTGCREACHLSDWHQTYVALRSAEKSDTSRRRRLCNIRH